MKRVANAASLPDLPEEVRAAVLDVTGRLKHLPGALLPVLHGVQEALGHVPENAVPLIARELNLSRADVHGVIYLCRAESCQAMGAATLEKHVKQRLGVDFHQTTADGALTLEPVYCLGNCACSPAMMVDDELKGRLTPEGFDAWLAAETK
jgi:formate dehydrogenase subunit gamma